MATIPGKEPQKLRAGDSWRWRRDDLAAYPAPVWSLKYYLVSPNRQIVLDASADGAAHVVAVSAAASAAYLAGLYSWIARVSAGGEEYTVGDGAIEILPNFATAAAGLDGRSHAKRMLDALTSIIEGRAASMDIDIVDKTLGEGVALRKNPELLIKYQGIYARQYRAEQEAQKLANGEASGRKVLVKFL